MKISLGVLFLALCISGCQYEIWDLHFGPSPGDGLEEIKIEDIHEKNYEKNCC